MDFGGIRAQNIKTEVAFKVTLSSLGDSPISPRLLHLHATPLTPGDSLISRWFSYHPATPSPRDYFISWRFPHIRRLSHILATPSSSSTPGDSVISRRFSHLPATPSSTGDSPVSWRLSLLAAIPPSLSDSPMPKTILPSHGESPNFRSSAFDLCSRSTIWGKGLFDTIDSSNWLVPYFLDARRKWKKNEIDFRDIWLSLCMQTARWNIINHIIWPSNDSLLPTRG